jgi:hypothetical protein
VCVLPFFWGSVELRFTGACVINMFFIGLLPFLLWNGYVFPYDVFLQLWLGTIVAIAGSTGSHRASHTDRSLHQPAATNRATVPEASGWTRIDAATI